MKIAPAGPAALDVPSGRVVWLDLFRGLTIAAMLLVNHQGDGRHVHPLLEHAEWNGWTPADLVFPSFLLIVGVSMALSFDKQLNRGGRRKDILRTAARRSAKLVLLGLLLAGFPWWQLDPTHLRIPGVLQRIGLAFLLATPIVLWLGVRWQLTVVVALLVGYPVLLLQVPGTAGGRGFPGPGEDLGARLDRAVFGSSHLWPGERDPEGMLSTLPAVASVLIGVFAGRWIQASRNSTQKAAGLLLAGGALACLGLVWDLWLPINKNLWTSSFVLFSGGIGLLLLAVCYFVADVMRVRRWLLAPVVLGANSILVYVLATLAALVLHQVPLGSGSVWTATHQALFASWLTPRRASLAFAVAYLLFWTAAMTPLYRKHVYVRL